MRLKGCLINYFGNSTSLAWILMLNVGVWFFLTLFKIVSPFLSIDFSQLECYFALGSDVSSLLRAPWTIMLYMVVQISFFHLFFNILWIYWFGLVIERERKGELLKLYIGGGLSGALFFILTGLMSKGPEMWLIGSSAAGLALMTASAVWNPNLPMRFFLIGDIRLKWLAPIAVLLTFLCGSGGVGALAAHVGGVVFGIVYAMICDKEKIGIKREWIRNDKNIYKGTLKINKPEIKKDATEKFHLAASNEERLNELLDKINKSGYSSLQEPERRELDFLSRNVKKSSLKK